VVLAISLGAAGQSVAVGVRQYEYVRCQAAWSQAYASSAMERGVAGEADRIAFDTFLDVLADPRSTAAQRARAFTAYHQMRLAANAQRHEHPAPPLPDTVCQ
jgi:hypothetical protein